MTLKLAEIFYSIQGESIRAGYPCVFIRLAGCNLRCTYCDTVYAQSGGTHYSIMDILNAVLHYPCRLVEITGGEPLLQDQTPDLVQELLGREYTVLLETNGSIPLDRLDKRCIKIVDVKCPSSGEGHSFTNAVLDGLNVLQDELKFVIADRGDYEFARDFIQRYSERIPGTVHFSPVLEKMPVAELATWIMTDGLSVRCTPQLHRFIWPNVERGV